MTHPVEIRDTFFATIRKTGDGAGAMFSGLFSLLFLFPAMVFVMVIEALIRSEALICRDPRPALLPATFAKRNGYTVLLRNNSEGKVQ